jgi:hypothetical protein
MNPIVNITKKKIMEYIEKNELKEIAQGNKNIISKSKIINKIATK